MISVLLRLFAVPAVGLLVWVLGLQHLERRYAPFALSPSILWSLGVGVCTLAVWLQALSPYLELLQEGD